MAKRKRTQRKSSAANTPAKKSGETYPLRLTQPQRESLIHATRIRGGIKERLKAAGDGAQAIDVTLKELNHLRDEIGQAALDAPKPNQSRLVAVLRKVDELLAADADDSLEAEASRSLLKTRPKDGPVILQFKITLLDVNPPVWRRIQVEDSILGVFHEDIQSAFGWENCHLHHFEINGDRYGCTDPDFDLNLRDEEEVAVSDLLQNRKRNSRWIYLYDYGDGWRHEIVFEGYVAPGDMSQYPLCLDGARACPPEDCGGPWGYAELLAALANRRHKRHRELREWVGPFDPEAFDAKQATKAMHVE